MALMEECAFGRNATRKIFHDWIKNNRSCPITVAVCGRGGGVGVVAFRRWIQNSISFACVVAICGCGGGVCIAVGQWLLLLRVPLCLCGFYMWTWRVGGVNVVAR